MMISDEISVVVCRELLKVSAPGIDLANVRGDSLLIEDLGLDSLRFVDLTVGLEDAMSIREFPMQRWVDDTLADGNTLTVERLVSACREIASRVDAL